MNLKKCRLFSKIGKIRIPWFCLTSTIIFLGALFFGTSAEKILYGFVNSGLFNAKFYKYVLYSEFPALEKMHASAVSMQETDIYANFASENEDKPQTDFEESSEIYNSDEKDYSYESVASANGILSLLQAKPISAVTISPNNPSGYVEHDGIYIKNSTEYNVDIESSLSRKIDLSFSAEGPHVLIIHTHGSESYSPEGKNYYIGSNNNRTTDNEENVIAVGNKLAEILNRNKIETLHITDLFDYPEYNGAYNRALDAIGKQMKETPSIKMIIDLHRDALISENGVKYKTVKEIDGKNAAQIMFVCGTDYGGLPHSNWNKNLRLMIRLQKIMNDKYGSLMRPIDLRKERFNQHVTSGSMLIEIGTSGNTLNEALYSAELLGNELAKFLSDYIK